jgi:hypothetical protein
MTPLPNSGDIELLADMQEELEELYAELAQEEEDEMEEAA